MLSGSKRQTTENLQTLEIFLVERLSKHFSDVLVGHEWEVRATLSARQFKHIRSALLEMPKCTHTSDDVWYYEEGVRVLTSKKGGHVQQVQQVQRKVELSRDHIPRQFTGSLFAKLARSSEEDLPAAESECYLRSLNKELDGCGAQDIPDIETKWKVNVHHQLTNLPPLFSSTETFIKANLNNFWYIRSGSPSQLMWFSRAAQIDGVHVPEACFSLETTKQEAEAASAPVPVFRRVRQRDSVELDKHVRLDLTHSVEYSRSSKIKHSWNVEIELLSATLPETVQESGCALADALKWVVDVVGGAVGGVVGGAVDRVDGSSV